MDMAIANLFKHKVHFKLTGHDPNDAEPYLPSKGYHYHSNEIENGESVGITSLPNLYLNKLDPLLKHIQSTIILEIENISSVSIMVHIICEEHYDDYDIVWYEFEPTPECLLEETEVRFYTFPENLLNDKFSIYMEAYAYIATDLIREMEAFYEEGIRLAEEEEINNNAPEETFCQERCVVCLESVPNILYLDCMHIAVCNSCDAMKRTSALRKNCDICRAEISRRIKI